MRNLEQITAAARIGGELTEKETRFALCAYDVLYAQITTENTAPLFIAEYFKAAETAVDDYVGEANSPENPEFIEWYKVMHKMCDDIEADGLDGDS